MGVRLLCTNLVHVNLTPLHQSKEKSGGCPSVLGVAAVFVDEDARPFAFEKIPFAGCNKMDEKSVLLVQVNLICLMTCRNA